MKYGKASSPVSDVSHVTAAVTSQSLPNFRRPSGSADVDAYLNDMLATIRKYEELVGEIKAVEKPKWLWLPGKKQKGVTSGATSASPGIGVTDPESMHPMVVRREELKRAFIAKKQAIRALLALDSAAASKLAADEAAKLQSWLPTAVRRLSDPTALATATETRAKAEAMLLTLQQQFREADAAFKATKLGSTRVAAGLFDSPSPGSGPVVCTPGRGAGRGAGTTAAHGRMEDGTRGTTTGRARSEEKRPRGPVTTDDYIERARSIEGRTTQQLKVGLVTLELTKGTATATAEKLAENREQIQRVDAGLDELQSELHIARGNLARIVKRLANDKIIIAFTLLVILGLVGLVTYMVITKQTTISVPGGTASDAKPSVSG